MANSPERKSRLLGTGEIDVSFEFFPPKTDKMEAALWSVVERLDTSYTRSSRTTVWVVMMPFTAFTLVIRAVLLPGLVLTSVPRSIA